MSSSNIWPSLVCVLFEFMDHIGLYALKSPVTIVGLLLKSLFNICFSWVFFGGMYMLVIRKLLVLVIISKVIHSIFGGVIILLKFMPFLIRVMTPPPLWSSGLSKRTEL
jgi:hypothetical protein